MCKMTWMITLSTLQKVRVIEPPFPTGMRMVWRPVEAPLILSCLSWLAGIVSTVCCEPDCPECSFNMPTRCKTNTHTQIFLAIAKE